MKPKIQPFFDPATGTVTYVVHDGAAAAIIDSVLGYEPLPRGDGRSYLKIPLNAL
jgi:hypothetical protein